MSKSESERHKLLKEYGKLFLQHHFGVPKEHIHEEFSVGSTKFDVIAYPPVEMKGTWTIGMECGQKKSNVKENYEHFSRALNFVDIIFWIPYTIYRAPYADMIRCKIGDVFFQQFAYDILDERFVVAKNTVHKDKMYFLFITKQGRFPEIETHPIATYSFKGDEDVK